jgi:hypothetical protein
LNAEKVDKLRIKAVERRRHNKRPQRIGEKQVAGATRTLLVLADVELEATHLSVGMVARYNIVDTMLAVGRRAVQDVDLFDDLRRFATRCLERFAKRCQARIVGRHRTGRRRDQACQKFG